MFIYIAPNGKNAPTPFKHLRFVAFGLVLILTLVPLGIAGKLVARGFAFPVLNLAVSIITIVTLISVLIIDYTRKGSPTSWTIVELGWWGILWVLWLAAAVHPAATVVFTGPCNARTAPPFERFICTDFHAITLYSWSIWFTITLYIILLATMASIHYSRGNRTIWQTSTADYNFFAPGSQIPPAAAMQHHPQEPQEFEKIVQPQPVLTAPHLYAAVSPQVTGTTPQPNSAIV